MFCVDMTSVTYVIQSTGDTGRFISKIKKKKKKKGGGGGGQNWLTNLHSSSKCDVYKSYKTVIMNETNLGGLEQKYFRDVCCRFRNF